jgi:hypothetical protein
MALSSVISDEAGATILFLAVFFGGEAAYSASMRARPAVSAVKANGEVQNLFISFSPCPVAAYCHSQRLFLAPARTGKSPNDPFYAITHKLRLINRKILQKCRV